MAKGDYAVILITVGSYEEGRKIAEALVSARKAACVNIVPQIESIYWWEGKVEDDRESLLIAKTKSDLFPELLKLVKELHSYEVPEVIAIPIAEGNPDYLSWIKQEAR